jgi:hypothetical protein
MYVDITGFCNVSKKRHVRKFDREFDRSTMSIEDDAVLRFSSPRQKIEESDRRP